MFDTTSHLPIPLGALPPTSWNIFYEIASPLHSTLALQCYIFFPRHPILAYLPHASPTSIHCSHFVFITTILGKFTSYHTRSFAPPL
ncbi:uncharacterized protein LACBIDRAFT_305841 [Laccaria bicolor S238N-H82]|uniref:Predicted protein n=1 Tax=Laccaria bicolor (strain S238N-H82 / ATCC MYA-4686) TaxID=486041 RepID=B0CS23_LACBS|nr:uncharacterized protein LACBIDRAFT_305841 [Laccaria bicolor S238N-H82]EDR14779.1 predicted protein [Laccaria bicolor S238N-H82]|eukprot:XP_001875338.1 predicted protein [Laccaria bicolor S238N-H82]